MFCFWQKGHWKNEVVSVEEFSNDFKGKYSHMVRFRRNWRCFLYFGDGPGYQDCGKYFQRDKIHNSIELKYQANEGLQCIDPNLFQASLTGRISHPCRQCRDMEGPGWTLKQEGCQYFEKPAQDLSFLCWSCCVPRPVSAWALKSLHIFLGQGGIKILQHYRRLLVVEWAAFCKHRETGSTLQDCTHWI